MCALLLALNLQLLMDGPGLYTLMLFLTVSLNSCYLAFDRLSARLHGVH